MPKSPAQHLSSAGNPEKELILEITEYVKGAEVALRSAAQNALLGGMRLHYLRKINSAGFGGDRKSISVPRGTLIGFSAALAQIGISRSTAYRWIGGAESLCEDVLGLGPDDFPEPDSAEWEQLEGVILNHCQGISLRRLIIGISENGSDDQRQEELINRAEAGDVNAENVLELIAAGKLTLVQAMRAAAGALATKGKERKDPVYLDFDVESKTATGLIPKAFITLQNGFKGWEGYSPAAKTALRNEWHATRQAMPDELFPSKK